jgi:flagellar biosynthetic protein FliQ|tara:strand:- start:126 stop:392 length:267 start_codon:yes stop_codon:yes gene_type:complete
MEQAEVIESIREAIWLTIQISTPIMLVGLVVGVMIALLQALTQVQEITLVFVPKILAIFMAIFFLLPSFSLLMIAYMERIADRIIGGG